MLDTILIIIALVMVLMILWTYFGYGLALHLISFFYSKKIARSDDPVDVTLITTAYNEEANIARKIENCLEQTHPRDKMEIIVVSDGSTDRTDDIVRSYADRGVKLLRIEGRNGKHFGQGSGIRMAGSEIVILTDATTFLERDAVEKIVRNFADPRIGCVSGCDRIINTSTGNTGGEGMYVAYEMKLRRLESKVGSLVGASGCFFAMRKKLCDYWVDNMSSDFYLPLITYMRGYRSILDSEAIGSYEILARQGKEYERKVRTFVHGLEVLSLFRRALNPFRYGSFALQVFSHKLSRYLVPFYLMILFGASLMLINQGPLFTALVYGQVLFYGMALMATVMEPLRKQMIFRTVFFFAMANWAILMAWYNFLQGRDFIRWEPTKR